MEINKIYNEDCLQGMRNIPSDSIDLIVTDPPYKITSRGNSGNAGGMLATKKSMQGDIFDHNDCHIKEWSKECYRVLKEGSHAYFMCNHINLTEYLNTLQEVGFHFIKSLIWDKCNKIMGTAYMSQFEYILFFRKGKFKPVQDCGISDIITCPNIKPKDNEGKNLHDTAKPVSLMEILVMQSTESNEIVLDPFMGIGSTALACIKSNRNYIGYEIDPKYYGIAQRRINKEVSQLKIF